MSARTVFGNPIIEVTTDAMSARAKSRAARDEGASGPSGGTMRSESLRDGIEWPLP